MKSLRFFFSIAAFLRSKNQSRSFSLISGLLHLRCALMMGCDGVIFGDWGLLRRMTLIAPREVGDRLLRLCFCLGVGRGVSSFIISIGKTLFHVYTPDGLQRF